MPTRASFFVFFLFAFLGSFTSFSQTGAIAGIVIDGGNSRPLSGATILILSSSKNTVTDNDGNFKLTGLAAGNYIIRVSYVGYESKDINDIQVTQGLVTTINISLNLQKSNLKEVVITTVSARKENLSALLNLRKNAAVVSDGISADMIKKSPDKNTSDVLKRISGTTIQENKFVVVRGMNDRYNEAMLNGALLPSSEPDRKTFAFDIFPSDVVDNITIIKSASPEFPGSFSGGLIQINTKETPDKNFISLKAGLSFYSTITNKNYYGYHGGSGDWFGIDDGTRALPKGFPSSQNYASLPDDKKIQLARSFANNWAVQNKFSAPLSPQIQISGGFNAGKKNYPRFGGIFAITYNNYLRFNQYKRYDYTGGAENPVSDTSYQLTDSSYTRTILTSGLANFSLKINPNNKFFFNNLYSINSSDQTTLRSGSVVANSWNDERANSFFFISNRIFNSQIGGDHTISPKKLKLRIKWNVYYTNLKRDEPDYRRNTYVQFDPGSPYFALISSGTSAATATGVHYFANVKDASKGINIDASVPFKLFDNIQTFKAGGSYYYNTRTRDSRFFAPSIIGSEGYNYIFEDQATIYQHKNFNSNGFELLEFVDPKNHYDGSIKNTAAYIMMDNKLTSKLRLVWGARFESYHQVVNTFDDNSEPFKIDTTYKDFLPSANLIYSVLPKANIRASYSKTVARPLYRELANQLFYDFLQNITFFGNPQLIETHVNNYEVRWEQYFPNAQYYSISGFYKKFENPIEQYIAIEGSDSRTVGFQNLPTATNKGIEFEGRKNLDFISKGLENLFIYANLSLIKSKTDARFSAKDSSFRPLQGQSPYIVNAAIQYNEPKANLNISLLCNIIGSRLFLIGGQNVDPIWERPHATFDAKVSKSFLKNGIVEFSVSDILHKDDVQFWDLNNNKKYDAGRDALIQTKSFGFNMTLSVGYKF